MNSHIFQQLIRRFQYQNVNKNCQINKKHVYNLNYFNGLQHLINSLMFDSNQDENNKPTVYFLTQDFFADHVEELVEQLDKNNIPYVLQKETDTLGKPLDNRYFVVVDNIKGTVRLGAQFSSLLMFIVGYPRQGANKKNHYCKKPQEVVAKYKNFLKLPEFEKTIFTTSAIKSKSNLKSVKSIPRSKASSQLIHNRSQSVSSQSFGNSLKQRAAIKEIDDNSKVYLVLSQKILQDRKEHEFKSQRYNKYLLKIATSNPIKFKIIQNLDQLKINLLNSHGKNNHIVINYNDFQLLQNAKLTDNKLIIFLNPNDQDAHEKEMKLQKNIFYCKSHSSLVNEIRKAGFQAISLKDIDKSIIKYDNPFSKERKVPDKLASKKIIWVDSQSKIQQSCDVQVFNRNRSQGLPISQNKIGEASIKIITPNNLSNTFPKVNNESESEINKQNKVKVLQQLLAYNSDSSKNVGQQNTQILKVEKRQSEKETVSISSKNSVNFGQIEKATQVYLVSRNAPQYQMGQSGGGNEIVLNKKQEKPCIKTIKLDKIFPKAITQHKIGKIQQNTKIQQGKQVQQIGPQQKQTKSIRKIKRVKTQAYQRKKSVEEKFIEITLKNAVSQVRHIKRKIVLPQEYCNPVSPASEASPQDLHQKAKESTRSIKFVKRVLRSQSTQPSFSRIKQQEQAQAIYPSPPLHAYFSKITLPRAAPELIERRQESYKPIGSYHNMYPQSSYYTNVYHAPKKITLLKHNLPACQTAQRQYNEPLISDDIHNQDNPSLHLLLQTKENLSGSNFQTEKEILSQKKDMSVKTGQFNEMLATFGTVVCSAIQKIVNKPNNKQSRFSFAYGNCGFQGKNKIYNSSHIIEGFNTNSSNLLNPSNPENLFMRKTFPSSESISILWKEFNFDIQEGVVQLKKQLEHYKIREHSFFKADEIEIIIKNLPSNSKIIVLLDEIDLDKFLCNMLPLIKYRRSSQQRQMIGDIVGIYVYQKRNQCLLSSSSLNFSDDPKSINKKFKQMLRSNNLLELQPLTKLVIQNDYDDVNKRVASEICSKILSHNSAITN